MRNLASTHLPLGQAAEAVRLAERALAITEATPEGDPYRTAVCLCYLANIHLGLGRAADALPLAERAPSIATAACRPDGTT
jgi:hypothetical protein